MSLLHRLTAGQKFAEIEQWTIICGAARAPSDASLRPIWADDSSALSISTDHGSTAPTFVVTYDATARFEICYASREIVISALCDNLSDNTIEHLLVDQIWPRILANDGKLVLHAAGVSGPNGALLFVGQSGWGKSTLAASLHQRGLALLGDDAIVTYLDESAGDARCGAVYRSLRLFPDSIATLFEPSIDRSEVADYTDKQNIHLSAPGQPGGEPSIEAIFLLNPDAGHASASVSRVAPGDACMGLVEHSFWLDPTDLALTVRKLRSASALASVVPTYKLDYPRDFSRLSELHAAIFAVLADPSCPQPLSKD